MTTPATTWSQVLSSGHQAWQQYLYPASHLSDSSFYFIFIIFVSPKININSLILSNITQQSQLISSYHNSNNVHILPLVNMSPKSRLGSSFFFFVFSSSISVLEKLDHLSSIHFHILHKDDCIPLEMLHALSASMCPACGQLIC